MARRLNITEATVKVHIKAILRKVRVMNRTQAAIWALSRGLDRLDPPAESRYPLPAGRVPGGGGVGISVGAANSTVEHDAASLGKRAGRPGVGLSGPRPRASGAPSSAVLDEIGRASGREGGCRCGV